MLAMGMPQAPTCEDSRLWREEPVQDSHDCSAENAIRVGKDWHQARVEKPAIFKEEVKEKEVYSRKILEEPRQLVARVWLGCRL